MAIIYLHGFRSAGASPKVDALKAAFGAENVFAPDLPFDPAEVITVVRDLMQARYLQTKARYLQIAPHDTEWNRDKLIFVGTSLGGFYANYFGQWYDCPAVLVNPSTMPDKTLLDRVGVNKNHMSNEEFMVTLAHLDELAKMRNRVTAIYDSSLVNLFVAKDDEVIPYQIALDAQTFPFPNFVKVTETGGHRFSSQWDLVINRIKELM
jgi:predicted esterase YcpF (UPF0227 family)